MCVRLEQNSQDSGWISHRSLSNLLVNTAEDKMLFCTTGGESVHFWKKLHLKWETFFRQTGQKAPAVCIACVWPTGAGKSFLDSTRSDGKNSDAFSRAFLLKPKLSFADLHNSEKSHPSRHHTLRRNFRDFREKTPRHVRTRRPFVNKTGFSFFSATCSKKSIKDMLQGNCFFILEKIQLNLQKRIIFRFSSEASKSTLAWSVCREQDCWEGIPHRRNSFLECTSEQLQMYKCTKISTHPLQSTTQTSVGKE